MKAHLLDSSLRTSPTSMDIAILSHEIEYNFVVYLWNNCRLDLRSRRRATFAKVFGCAPAAQWYINAQDESPWRKERAR